MKYITRLLAILFTVLVGLIGCSKNNGKTLSLEEARAKYQANNEILGFLTIAEEAQKFSANEYGIALKKDTVRFMPGSAQALAWKLTAVRPMSLVVETRAVFPAEEAARIKKAALEKNGKEVHIAPYNPLTIGGKAAPLMETWVSWNYERKVERVMQLLMYQFVTKTLKRKDAESLALFLAEKATEEFLRKKLNPASPILARYISEKRDERTFATLFPDFAVRVRNLYENKEPTLDAALVQKTRTMLLSTWLADFRQKYADRFLTNTYVQFGNPLPGDAEIAAWENRYASWKNYNKVFLEAGENLKVFIEKLR